MPTLTAGCPEFEPEARVGPDRHPAPASGPGLQAGTEAGRRQATRFVLGELWESLRIGCGLPEVYWDEAVGVRAERRGVRGWMERGRVYVDPRHHRPETTEGRTLLAHEAVHVAQWRMGASMGVDGIGDLEAAEQEAEALARVFARGGRVRPPRVPLPAAANVGRAADERAPTVAELGDLVGTSRGREIQEIEEHLRRKWWKLGVITNGDVEKVLLILQGVPFVVARSIVQGITPLARERLLDNLNPVHFRRFRTEILAVFSAVGVTGDGEFEWLPDDPFDGMRFRDLTDEEHWALKAFIARWVAAETGRVQEVKRRHPEIERAIDLPTQFKLDDAVREAIEDEQALQSRREAAEARAAGGAMEETLDEVVELLSRGLFDWAVTNEEMLRVLDLLVEYLGDDVAMQTVVDRLEGEDLFDRFFEQLPINLLFLKAAARFSPERTIARRKVFLKLVNLRQPHRNVRMAERLLSTSFWSLDWMVSDEEAYLAFQLVKAVPERARARMYETESSGFFFGFAGSKGETFESLLNSEQSLGMRESETANPYSGGRHESDRVSIRAQLLRDSLWVEGSVEHLAGLVRMAIAAGDHEWVFQQSELRYPALQASGRYRSEPFYGRIVTGFALFDPSAKTADGQPAPRVTYSPEFLQGTRWYEEGLWTYPNYYLVQAGQFLARSDNPNLATRSFGGDGLNLYEFQDMMGGSFLGVRFAPPSTESPRGDRRVTRGDPDTPIRWNFADVDWDMPKGVLTMKADQLEIDAFHYPMAGLKIQSGRGSIGGLKLHLAYPTGDRPRQHLLKLEASRIDFRDLMFISTDSIFGLNQVVAGGAMLRADSGGVDYADPALQPREGIKVPIPIFWPLLGFLANLFKLNGTFGKAASDEMTAGLVEPQVPLEFEVQLGTLTIVGVTTSGGTHVGRIELTDVRLFGGETAASYRRALRQSLDHLEERRRQLGSGPATTQERDPANPDAVAESPIARLDRQIETARAELERLEGAEAALRELEPRESRGDLGEDDRDRLARAREVLREFERGGVTLDIGSGRVTGLDTGMGGAGEMDFDALHGQGRSATALLGFLTDSETIRRVLRGPDYQPVVPNAERREDTGSFSLDLGHVRLADVRLPGAIPTPREAARALDRVAEKLALHPSSRRLAKEHQRLLERYEAALAYDRIARKGLGDLDRLSEADLREFERARQLLQGTALEVDEVLLEGARFDLKAGGSEVGIHADDARVLGVRGAGWRIDGIHAVNFDLTGAVGGGLKGLLDFRRNLRHAGVTGDSFEVLGIHLDDLGGEITRISMGQREAGGPGVTAGLAFTEGDTFLQTPYVAIEGVNLTLTKALIEAELRSLRSRPEAELTPSQRERIRTLETALGEALGFEQLLAEARTPDDERTIRELMIRWQETVGLKTLVVENLDLAVLGLGNVLDEDYDFADQLAAGLGFAGRGPEDEAGARRIFSSATLTSQSAEEYLQGGRADPAVPAVTGRDVMAYGGRLGSLSGEVEFAHSEDFTRFTFRNVGLSELEVTTLHFGGAEMQVWSFGTSRLEGLRIDGHLVLRPKPDDPEARELVEVGITRLGIGKVTAQNLGVALQLPQKDGGRLDVIGEIESGSLEGLWAEEFTLSVAGRDAEGKPVYSLGGRAGITTVRDAKLRGQQREYSAEALDNLAAGRAFQSALTEAGGTVDASRLSIEFLGVDHFRLRTADLNLANGYLRSPDGRVRLWARGLTTGEEGYLEKEGNRWVARGLVVGTIGVPGFEWRAGKKKFSSTALTEFRRVEIDASVTRGEQGMEAFTIERLKILEVVSQHLRFEEDGLVVNLTPQYWTAAGAAALQVSDILITGLDWTKAEGMKAGRIRTGGARADLRTELTRGTKKLLDLGVGLTASSIDVRFQADGKVITRVEELAARFDGEFASESGTARGDVTGRIDAIAAGEVIYDRRNGRIEIPEFVLPKVSLSELNFEDDKYEVRGRHGFGAVVLLNVKMALALELNRDEPVAGAPTPPPFKKIEIQKLEVPTVGVRGLVLKLKQVAGGVRLSVHHSEMATLENLRLIPAPGDAAFTIVPSGTGWTPIGGLRLDRSHITELGFAVGKSLSGTTKVEAGALSIDFFAAGTNRVRLDGATLTEIRANLAGSNVSILTGASAHPGSPGITIGTLTKSETGELEVDDLGISNLVYEDASRGLKLDIRSATLPSGFRVNAAGDEITLPRTEIHDAIIKVDDVMRLGGGGVGGGGGTTAPFSLTDYRFLDTLNGHLDFSVDVELDGYPDQTFELEIAITDGVFNYDAMESDPLLEFHFFEDNRPGVHQLVVGVDMPNAADPESPEPPVEALYGLYRWTFADEEDVDLARRRQVRVRSLITSPQGSASSSGGPSPVTDLRFYDIDADLSLLRQSTIDFGPRGRVELGTASGKDGILNFTASGDSKTARGIELALAEVNASLHELLLVSSEDPAKKETTDVIVNTGLIHAENFHDAHLTFSGMLPKMLEGTLAKATADNITVRLVTRPTPPAPPGSTGP